MAKVKKTPVVKKTLPKLPDLNNIVNNDISDVFVSTQSSNFSNIFISDEDKDDITEKNEISSVFEDVIKMISELPEPIEGVEITNYEFDTGILLEVIEEETVEIEQITSYEDEDYEGDDYLTEQVETETKLAEPEIYSFNREKYFTGTHSLFNIKTSNIKSFLIYTNARNPKYIDDIFTQPFHITYNKEILVNYYTNIDTVWIEEQVLKYKDVEYNLSRIEIKFFSI